MKTPAIIFPEKNAVSICDLQISLPRKHEIQVRSRYSTISAGTESWLLRGLLTPSPARFPCVPGYQRAGIVEAVGPGVSGWQIGDRALALTGMWSTPDVERALGAHIGFANVPTALAYHLPGGVDEIDASVAVVAQVGYNAATKSNCNSGDWVLVYGDGLIGQLSAQAARARGARVVLVGHRKERLELAMQWSADAIINSNVENVAIALRRIVGRETVPIVLDSVQTLTSQKQYIDLVQRGSGQIVYNGFNPDVRWADVSLFQQRELTAHFVFHWTRERIEATLALMASQKLRVGPLITHLVPYTCGPAMYQLLGDKSEPFLGITLDWTGVA
jgi:bacteriochlorophyllide a dehydrogenase